MNRLWHRGRLIWGIGFSATLIWGALPPELPGEEVPESESPRTMVIQGTIPSSQPELNRLSLSWSAPSVDVQLGEDKTLIGINRGALFVPRMTEGSMEPEIVVIPKDVKSNQAHLEVTGQSGSRILLAPGEYHVYIGSGAARQRMHFQVQIEEGRTHVLTPDWCGLVIQTITNEGELVDEGYEIYDAASGESFGKGVGQPPERQKDLSTWILPTGIYRISRQGEDPTSLTNYITIQLNQGALTFADLTFDAESGDLIAGGVNPKHRRSSEASPWTFGMMLGGTATLGATIINWERQSDSWAGLVDFRLSARYDKASIFGFNELRTRNNFQIVQEENDTLWVVNADLMTFQSNWVYQLNPWIGPYSRISVKTHLLKKEYVAPEDSVITVLHSDGKPLRSIADGDPFRTEPVGFPFRLGEGVGGSLRLTYGSGFEVQAQSGLAWRQIWVRRVYERVENVEGIVFQEAVNQYDWGQESQIVLRMRLGNVLTIDLVGEVFLPQFRLSDYELEELSLDVRLALTRHFEISYIQQLIDQGKDVDMNERFVSENSVQFRFYFNY